MYAADLRTATAIRDHRNRQPRHTGRRHGRTLLARLVAELVRGESDLSLSPTSQPVRPTA